MPNVLKQYAWVTAGKQVTVSGQMQDPLIQIEIINQAKDETPVGKSLTGLLTGIDTHYLFPLMERDLEEYTP